ncbi:MAG: 1,4-dihydroxy-2-naphthoate octaprenyltransferase [Candidatus Omnitrophota bacterium]|nr:1,4-dihydroxy-2-naphthoate octaprenyltransferase [Candidatus Omnitrophota bacterium]
MNFKIWLKAVRIPFFTATVIPVLFGYLLAWRDGHSFIWHRFLLTLFGAIFIHAGTNLANDYFDYLAGCDEANPTPTPFSGGSRVIQNGQIMPKKILYASLLFFILGSGIGLYLNYICGGNVILVLGAIGVFFGFFYSARPFKIGYGGFGELATGIGFGPLMVMGAYYVGAQQLTFRIFFASMPIGILIALVLFINEFPDYIGDKAVGKRTWVVILGKKNAIFIYYILLAAVYVIITALALAKSLPYTCLIAVLSLPVAFKAFTVSRNNYEKIHELLPVNAATIGLHSMIGILLCAGIAIDKIFVPWR